MYRGSKAIVAHAPLYFQPLPFCSAAGRQANRRAGGRAANGRLQTEYHRYEASSSAQSTVHCRSMSRPSAVLRTREHTRPPVTLLWETLIVVACDSLHQAHKV
jgi:hypothetical protein